MFDPGILEDMSKSLHSISRGEQKLITDALKRVSKSFSGQQGVENFLSKVLTEAERVAIGRRVLIAQMILSNMTYFEINEKLNVSPNTYSKVRKWLQAELPEYQKVLAESTTTAKTKKRKHIEPFSLQHLQKKYPMHFLLISLAHGSLKR